MSLNDQIRRNSYEVKLASDSSENKEYELSVRAVDYAKTPDIRSQIPRGGVKARLKEQEDARNRRGKMSNDTCSCPNCGYSEPKIRGVPCRTKTCPECGSPLQGRGLCNI